MKTIWNLHRSVLFVWLIMTHSARAAVVVYDSFDQDPFSLALFGSDHDGTVNLPLATRRGAYFNGREGFVSPGTTMTANLDANVGRLALTISGEHLSTNPWVFLDFRLEYSGGGGRNITGYDGFTFHVDNLLGEGGLIVRLGSDAAIYGATTPRISLTGPGDYFVPFYQMSIAPGESVNQFNSMHFIFEAYTPEFAMTLHEIRLVPEPGTPGLVLGAGLWCLRRSAGRRSRAT